VLRHGALALGLLSLVCCFYWYGSSQYQLLHRQIQPKLLENNSADIVVGSNLADPLSFSGENFRYITGRLIHNICTGIAFVAVYIFLIVFATLQTRSAANAPKSQLGGYSTSDYGWEVTYFNTYDFIDAPKALSGRLSTGKNIKCTGRY
jgi:hypothetical protein